VYFECTNDYLPPPECGRRESRRALTALDNRPLGTENFGVLVRGGIQSRPPPPSPSPQPLATVLRRRGLLAAACHLCHSSLVLAATPPPTRHAHRRIPETSTRRFRFRAIPRHNRPSPRTCVSASTTELWQTGAPTEMHTHSCT